MVEKAATLEAAEEAVEEVTAAGAEEEATAAAAGGAVVAEDTIAVTIAEGTGIAGQHQSKRAKKSM